MVHSEIHRSHPDKVQVSKKEDRDRGVYRGLTKKTSRHNYVPTRNLIN